jgi:hypothetical protein
MGKFVLRPRSIREWLEYYDYQRDRRRRNEDDGGEPEPPVEPDVAAALPAVNTDAATLLNSTVTSNRYSFGTTFPAADWTLGFWIKSLANGIVFSVGPTSSIYTANGHFHIYAGNEIITATGKDSAGNLFAVSSANSANTSSRGISSQFNPPLGMAVFFCLRKVGSLVQMWLKWPGHAPVKVAEEFSTFGVLTGSATNTWVGQDRSGSFKWHGQIRKLFFVSYALTDAQIDATARGADPGTFGTPAVTDYHMPNCPPNATWTGTLNGIDATRFLTSNYFAASGLGYSEVNDAVFIIPTHDGKVYQRESNNRATVPLSGTYIGDAAPIQVLPIDSATNLSVGNWTTVAASPSGGVWSGEISLPARNGWYKFQTRKVIDGVPSANVMTTSLRIGVGEVVLLMGQSSMDNIGSGASNPLVGGVRTNSVAPNGLWSESQRVGYLINGVGKEDVNIVGATNVGGQIQLQTEYSHGARTGQRVRASFVGGTEEANGEWIITVNGNNTILLNGSVFTNAYTSGGFLYRVAPKIRIPNLTTQPGLADGHSVIGNYLSSQLQMPVMLINRAVGAAAIQYFSSYTYAGVGTGGAVTVLHAKHTGKIGSIHWIHGQANIGQNEYFSDSGSLGSYTGWGLLGTLYDFFKAEFPNNDFKFGIEGFSTVGGIMSALSPASIHSFRMAYKDWVERKNAAGDNNVFWGGFANDYQPMWENAVPLNSHKNHVIYKRLAARVAHSYAAKLGAVGNSAEGPSIMSASRSGAVITLAIAQNGGSALRILRSGAKVSGFEVSADDFATKLSIDTIELISANQIRLTLASNPGAAVKVRYQFGYVGDYTPGTYFTPRITGVADNGSGAIRITCSLTTTAVTPNGSQAVDGHGLVDGDWILIQEVDGTLEANGIWEVDVIDSENFDLIGSTFTNAFVSTAGQTPIVVRELAVPVYDNRTIGGYDINGAPLAPTKDALTAA